MEWSPLENAALYELKIRFHYVEQEIANLSNTIDTFIDWTFPYRLPTSSITSESISLDAEQFLNFLAVNIDENPMIAQKYEIRSIPALMLFKEGKLVSTQVGLQEKSTLKEWINEHI